MPSHKKGPFILSGSRDKILQAAEELLHERGYGRTSVDDILKKSGVRKSNFYYHFTSKEELGLTVLDKIIIEYELGVLSPTLGDTSISPSKRLNNYYKKVISTHRKLKCRMGSAFGNLAIETSDSNERFREKLSGFFTALEKTIAGCIADGIQKGEFRSDMQPKVFALLILSHLEGAIMMAKTRRSLKPLTTGSETILSLLKAR